MNGCAVVETGNGCVECSNPLLLPPGCIHPKSDYTVAYIDSNTYEVIYKSKNKNILIYISYIIIIIIIIYIIV